MEKIVEITTGLTGGTHVSIQRMANSATPGRVKILQA